MLQGNAYEGSRAQPNAPHEDISGRNMLLRWNRTAASGAALQVQAYYDRTERDTIGSGFTIDIYDLDVQHSFAPFTGHEVVWDGGVRVSRHNLRGVPTFYFDPPRRTFVPLVRPCRSSSIARRTAVDKCDRTRFSKTVAPCVRVRRPPVARRCTCIRSRPGRRCSPTL